MQFRKSACIVLSLLSVNSFAMNDGVKIISEKITITPGFTGGFVSLTEKKTSPTVTSATVFVTGRSGKVNEFIKIDANHSINILNKDNRVNRYSYHYILKCADGEAKYDRTIEIPANGSFQNASYSYLAIQSPRPGTFRINAQTTVDGADSADARDSADLSVYK